MIHPINCKFCNVGSTHINIFKGGWTFAISDVGRYVCPKCLNTDIEYNKELDAEKDLLKERKKQANKELDAVNRAAKIQKKQDIQERQAKV